MVILGLGWVFLVLFLASAYFFNKLSDNSNASNFNPISWDNHMQVFNGAIQCKLLDDDLVARKKVLKETIFSQVIKKEESLNGFTYYFKDDPDLLASVFEHVQIEKACCSFFKFDISILPFKKGFAVQVSGSEDAFEMIKKFEASDL